MHIMIEAVNQAVYYIEQHLTDKLTLSEVADAVHYSKYHLHRIFSETAGTSMHSYIQRRRLTEAARLLIHSDKPIVDIGHTAGYDSQQAFSTIFKAMYKLPPNQFRANGEYYPLQLAYDFGKHIPASDCHSAGIRYATNDDTASWMELAHLVVDGFPCWEHNKYIEVLQKCIRQKRALLLKSGSTAIGSMIMNPHTGSIDFLGIHPFYKKRGISRLFTDFAKNELAKGKPISITTFREGDKADTGYRKALIDMGFKASELLVEFGYPTQRLVLEKTA